MTDILDKAQAIEEQQRELALRRFQAVHRPSKSHCEDCGEAIPQKRRELVVGCARCIDCQQIYEIERRCGR
ncbi:molecular chaperone DnaK [Pasteurellaceae bacterium Pebbles2]|nr:molecular chaperone DnaK [Pasteurellaceae bacterium Pebbles2]